MLVIEAVVWLLILAREAVLADKLEMVEGNFRDLCDEKCNGSTSVDLSSLLQLPPYTGLSVRARSLAPSGKTKVRYNQMLSGIAIYGTVLTSEIHSDGTFEGRWRGELLRTFSGASMSVAVSPLEALRALADKFYPGQRSQQLEFSDLEYHKESLIWYPQTSNAQLRLAYRCRFKLNNTGAVEPVIPAGVVDAITGQVLSSWNAVGFQQPYLLTGIGGNQGPAGMVVYSKIPVTLLSDAVTCQYATNSVQVQNLNGALNGTFSAAKTRCDSAANLASDFVNGGYSATNDAAMFGALTVSMYQSYLGLQSPVASPPVNIRVHYGTAYTNAFWDGTSVTIGDGGTSLYPLSVLDIVAHEISHGFTQSHSDLQMSGQPGGINEAFSDAAGQAAKYFYSGTTDFLVGSLATKSGSPLRNMCNPPSDGQSIANISQYQPNMDIHYSSGLFNKAFCILASTTNWTVASAFWAYAWANAMYWGQLTTFSRGVCGVRYAAIDAGANPADVDNAFASVGLTCQ